MTAVGACKSWGRTRNPRGYLRARCEVGGHARDCRVADLTPGGLFVESFVPATTGSTVKLHLRLPNGYEVSTRGVVSRHEFSVGFDVDFLDLSSSDREQIVSLAV
jgi:hypothetical protein